MKPDLSKIHVYLIWGGIVLAVSCILGITILMLLDAIRQMILTPHWYYLVFGLVIVGLLMFAAFAFLGDLAQNNHRQQDAENSQERKNEKTN